MPRAAAGGCHGSVTAADTGVTIGAGVTIDTPAKLSSPLGAVTSRAAIAERVLALIAAATCGNSARFTRSSRSVRSCAVSAAAAPGTEAPARLPATLPVRSRMGRAAAPLGTV